MGDETLISRIEREIEAFRAVLRRNRPLGVTIAIIVISYGLYLSGWRPFRDDPTVLTLLREYQKTSIELQRVTAELEKAQHVGNQARVQQLERQLVQKESTKDESFTKLLTETELLEENAKKRALIEFDAEQVYRMSLDVVGVPADGVYVLYRLQNGKPSRVDDRWLKKGWQLGFRFIQDKYKWAAEGAELRPNGDRFEDQPIDGDGVYWWQQIAAKDS